MPDLTWGLAVLVLIGPLLVSAPLQAGVTIDVFTVHETPITGVSDPRLHGATVQVYALDGVARLQAALSTDLPREPTAAGAEALRRLAALDDTTRNTAQRAANGITKARGYDIDRIPAIVVNGEVVLYGITELNEAQQRYDAWRSQRRK